MLGATGLKIAAQCGRSLRDAATRTLTSGVIPQGLEQGLVAQWVHAGYQTTALFSLPVAKIR